MNRMHNLNSVYLYVVTIGKFRPFIGHKGPKGE
jgi:hypothetical protein